MKVLNLRCAHDHQFEGWFASETEFQNQVDNGLLVCPLCGDAAVQRLPSAPRLNLGAKPLEVSATTESKGPAPSGGSDLTVINQQEPSAAMQALWLQAVQHVMVNTQDVGDQFPEEARRIHYGEQPHRPIRGRASPDEVEAMRDEGIELMSLPIPAGLKGPVQ